MPNTYPPRYNAQVHPRRLEEQARKVFQVPARVALRWNQRSDSLRCGQVQPRRCGAVHGLRRPEELLYKGSIVLLDVCGWQSDIGSGGDLAVVSVHCVCRGVAV